MPTRVRGFENELDPLREGLAVIGCWVEGAAPGIQVVTQPL